MPTSPALLEPGALVSSSGDPMVAVTGLRKTFGKVVAVDGIDLEVPQGSVLSLLGPNGAGKTTTVRILATLVKPDSGSVKIAGFDAIRQAKSLRRAIGLAGQEVALDAHLTGRENLVMVGRLYHLPSSSARQRADDLLERFDLSWAANRSTKTYSGGMRRRLDLASSLIGRPRVLFLDEPTTGLDPRAREGLWEVIEGLVEEGVTLLLTTQYLEEADRLSDSIAVIDHGRVIASGSPDDLKRSLGEEVLEVTLRHRTDIPAAQKALSQLNPGALQIDPSVARLRMDIPGGTSTLVEAIRRLDVEHIELSDVVLHKPTLDDVFLKLTGAPAATGGGDAYECDEGERSPGNTTRTSEGAPPNAAGSGPTGRILRIGWMVDYIVICKRNLLRYLRLPNLLATSTIEPIMLVLLFIYVFGGVMKLEVHNYVDFLMPGIFVQAVLFGSTQTGIGLAQDLTTGIVQRFRSLPIARSAVLAGRTLSDVVRNVGVVLLVTGVGLLLGFRIHEGPLSVAAALGILVLFGLAFSWVSAVIGLIAGDVESSQAASFVWVLPLTFVSSAFLPISFLPGWLQAFAKADPVTHTVDVLRALISGGPVAGQLWETLAWLSGIVAVSVPIAVLRYRKAV